MMPKITRSYAVRIVLFMAVLLFGIEGNSMTNQYEETANAAAESYRELFPPLEGWEQPADIDVYDPETLWDIINGAADLFYAYDFQELYWGRYNKSNNSDLYIVMEIYRQGDPVTAFGVYSQERPRPPGLVDVGVEGFAAPGALHFFVADLYVRMRSHDTTKETAAAMERLANKVSQNVDPDPAYPAILNLLPEEGRTAYSEEFINKNFLGHTFLSGAFVSGYEVNGVRFNLFVIEHKNSEECKKMLADYYEFSGQDPNEISEGIHRIEDRWNGEVGILWKGRHIYGYYNLDDVKLQEKYLDLFSGS